MSSIFINGSGYSLQSESVISHFLDILEEVQDRYGERDKTFAMFGVEVTTMQYPNELIDFQNRQIILQITQGAMLDIQRAVFQLSHAAVHCLSPTLDKKRTILEKGLATYFSKTYSQEKNNVDWQLYLPKHIQSFEWVEQLLAIDSEIVKKVRAIQPTISLVDKELLLQVNSKIPEDLAEILTKNFRGYFDGPLRKQSALER